MALFLFMIDFKQKMEEAEKRERKERASISDWPTDPEGHKKRRRITTYTIAIVVVALVFSGRILISSQSGSDWLQNNSFFNTLRRLVPSVAKTLPGEDEDRVNILLLGMGGEGHDGAYLTDTMMLASIKPSTKQIALISIPRDLVAPVNNWQKINSINAYAEQAVPGSGGEATKAAISELLQIPIQYYVRVDFNGFAKIIDEIGGIKVNVENTLDDYSYPIHGEEENPDYYARFEHLHIDKGEQTMDGSLALKYARSRHALSLEGSDFARAKRQQLVLEAVKDKILSKQTLLNPVTIGKLVSEFSQNVSTDLDIWEILRLWELAKDVDRAQIINKVLSDAPDGLLAGGKGDSGAYILMPRTGNFSEIRLMVKNIFPENAGTGTEKQDIMKEEEIEKISDDASVIILNGTWISGLATKTSVHLEQAKFNVNKVGNAATRDYSRTTIYDLTLGNKNASLEILKRATGGEQAFDSPAWLEEYRQANPASDFLLILGTDANTNE